MFALKRAFMKAQIDKKKKREPFDYKVAEAFSISSYDDKTINNSYYFSAHSKDDDKSLYVRLALRGGGACEVWVYYRSGAAVYRHKRMLYGEKYNPLTVEKSDGKWLFAFNGTLEDDKGSVYAASIRGEFTAVNKAIDFFHDMPSVRTATAMAQEKWTKRFFADVRANNQVHYEQEGKLSVEADIGGNSETFTLCCVRDHSFGKREWKYMNNHLWLMGVADGVQLNFSVVSYPAMTILEVGNVRLGDKLYYVYKAEYDRNAIKGGKLPQSLDILLMLDGGKKVRVEVSVISSDEYVFEDGAYRLTEGIADITVDGEPCRGIAEIGFNGDAARWFNGKDTKDLKA